MDMTAVWVAEHGGCSLNAIIDYCTRQSVGWGLERSCRAVAAIAGVERAVMRQAIPPATLTLASDNGSALTARKSRALLSGLAIARRRGGYRDPQPQASIESWLRYLKEHCVWRHELETLDQASNVIAASIDHYHQRPHSGLDYRTPKNVRQTLDDAHQALQKAAT